MPETHTVGIAARNGPLAQIWLAANMSNLARGQVLQTSISESADEIAKASGCDESLSNIEHITLRTSGELLQGIVRVYSKQAAFLLSDIMDTLTKISTLFRSNQRSNIAAIKASTIATVDQLILEDAVTEKDVLAAPGLGFLEDSEGVMGQETTINNNQRKVQGATPWDTSLEFGRRFNPDDDLENNQSSGLDLDFDIDEGQLSKTVEEGTRQTMSQDDERHGSGILDSQQPGHAIEDDDFPLEDPSSVDWDLGISENKDQDRHSEVSSHDSVEVGRRAEERSATDEPIDFGFNLDIDKDTGEEQDGQDEQGQDRLEQQVVATLTNSGRTKRNPALESCKKIQQDVETELDDHEFKNGPVEIQLQQAADDTIRLPRLTQKRLWEDMARSLEYLPQEAIERLIPLQTSKRQKKHFKEGQGEDFNEPQIDISLGLSDDLLQESSLNSSFPPSDAAESDHDVPMDADIGDYSLDQEQAARSENILERQSTQQGSDAQEPSSQVSDLSGSQKIQLNTGEYVSKEAVDFAELLRTEFMDKNSLAFDSLLAARSSAGGSADNKLVTKQEATRGFFDMLSLATSDCINLDQKDTFGEINITAKPSLYERFIPV